MNWLVKLDYSVLYLINKTLAADWLNEPMLLIRNALTWVPLYIFFLVFFYTNCRKYFFPIVVLTLFTFAITDYASVEVIKPLVARLRPCQNPDVPFVMNNITGCGGKYSFPSAHASNHFGLAALWFFVISSTLGKRWYWLWLWALLIGVAQIYVGVHFPGDVLSGAVLGTLIALISYAIFTKWKRAIDKQEDATANTVL